MEFRETLLAAQRNQQEKSSASLYYKARFDPPKKEQKQRDRLSANIQKFLAKKDEEEKQKKLEAQRKREELLAMRDPKALRKIQKTLKVIKSANKSVLEDAIDRDHTAITLQGPEQPDQDDYGYESQESAALYQKMMQKYSKIPDEPKFPVANTTVKKDLNGTRERVKQALQHEDDPVPHKRRRKTENGEKDPSPPPKEGERRKEDQSKPDKPKVRKPMPPPMDFNQLLKLAEQKKSEPIEVAAKKMIAEQEAERLMTKKQKREYEEEMARRQRRLERLEAEKAGGTKIQKEETVRDKKPESGGFGRIPKVNDKMSSNQLNDRSKASDRDKYELERVKERQRQERDKAIRDKSDRERSDREKFNREKLEKERLDREKLDRMRAERERLDREIERLNKDRERLDKTRTKLESKSSSVERTTKSDKGISSSRESNNKQEIKKNIDLKSQNTYRIDKNPERKFTIPSKNDGKYSNGQNPNGKPIPKVGKDQLQKNDRDKVGMIKQKCSHDGSPKLNGRIENGKCLPENGKVPLKNDRTVQSSKSVPGSSKEKISNSFDFDKHVNSLKNTNGGKRPDGGRQFPPSDVRRKMQANGMKGMPKRRAVPSDSEYDSEMDDFIDDGDENMDYSTHIREIFGYDKSKYRDIDDDDDPMMESSFARQQREEYISKKIGIMEDLEDMKMEAMEKKRKKKTRRLSDD
ncbi:protein SPT2 homolog [Amyelois transitella]|uniref:protein SPT2 homolog n=1 Tax=Amyelois transitella TaxID=680683 RepID=UPI00298F9DFD|nr:protein SPT2 homolog [Amyelois transitella]